MTSKERIDVIRNKSIPIFKKCGVVRSSLFGSAARDEQTEHSDIDFLVEFEKGRSLFDLVHCKQELEAAFQRGVDVITYDTLRPEFRDRVEREQIEIL